MKKNNEKNKPGVSILIPCYNEEKGIKDTIDRLQVCAVKNKWDIIVIDDGSTDGTAEILGKIKGIRVVSHPYNKGYGAALKTGIMNAETPLVVFYDGDGQHNPVDVENLLRNFNNFDMLVGERGKGSHRDWLRAPGKWLLTKIANILTERKIPDLNSGLRVIKREIISKYLHLMPDGFSFSTTSTIAFMNLGYNVGYFPITVNKRTGKSSVKQLKHGSGVIILILRLIALFNPLKIFLPVSLFLFLVGTIYEIIFGIILFPGTMRLIPGALFLLVSSIIIFLFGLLVDQISELRKYGFNK